MVNSKKSQAIKPAMISRSSYTTGFRCRYATYLMVDKPHLAKPIGNELVLISGEEFGKVAAKHMDVTYTVKFSKNKEKMVEDTQKAIVAGHKIIAEASFMSNNMFCSVDILKINDDKTITFYEVKSSSEIKEIHKFDVAFQYELLKSIGYEVKQANLIYANGTYCFDKGEELNLDCLFVIEDMTNECIELAPIVKSEVDEIAKCLETFTVPEHDFSSSCNAPYKCPFMDYCIKEAGLPEDTNIFNIAGAQFNATKLNKWYFNGLKTYQDIIDNLEVKTKKNGEYANSNWKYIQQAEVYLNKKDAPIQMEKLGEFLDTIKYPLASFDYEGFESAVPHFFGLKPSQQIVFQFSYDYIEYEGAERKHYDCLASSDPNIDPRYAICEALVKLPKANSILVWNKTYEKSRNEEMAQLDEFSKFKDVLLEMVDNFVDLMVPFRERIITPWKANGSYSLKPITEAMIPNLQYYDLKVHNGTEAAEKFLEMHKMKATDKTKCEQALKQYNNQDTYGPLKILEKMFRIYTGNDDFVLFTDKTQKDVMGNTLNVGDTVTCNRGIGVITKISDKYINVMLMNLGEEVRRTGKRVVLIQKYVTDKPRNISSMGKIEYDNLVACDRGIGKVYGFTKSYVRIMLWNGNEIRRMPHKIINIQTFIEN